MEVEKDVPMPTQPSRPQNDIGWIRKKYPFERMEVGDSFFVEYEQASRKGQTLRSAVSHRNNRNNRDGKLFLVKRVDGGFRCWRVE